MSHYDRIPRERLAAGPRGRILDALRRSPGLCRVELQRATGFSWGRLHHHVGVLETFGLVVTVRVGHRLRHYTDEESRTRNPRNHAFTTHPVYGDLFLAVRAQPGLTQSDCMRARPHRSRPAVAYALGQLVRAGLVRTARDGRHRRYWPTPSLPLQPP